MSLWKPSSREFSSTIQMATGKSLRRQLALRLLLVFMLVAVMGNVVVFSAYQGLLWSSQKASADDAMTQVRAGFEQAQKDWARNAREVKSEVDFMRIFADDVEHGWLRLRAYFATLEGTVGKFQAGLVLGPDGQPRFQFGQDSTGLSRLVTAQSARAPQAALPAWYFSPEPRLVHALVQEPIWLGPLGQGRLLLMQPIDTAALRALAPPDVRLLLVMDGQIVASSAGTADRGRALDASQSGRRQEGDETVEQRSLLVSQDRALPLHLVLQQTVRSPLSTPWVLGVSTIMLVMLTLLLWVVIGRWATRMTRRVALLSRVTNLFGVQHQITPQMEKDLELAASSPDEIAEVAHSCRDLMHNVLVYDEEHFAYVQTLDILEEGVVELAEDGTYLRASPGWLRLTGRSRNDLDERIYSSLHPSDRDTLQLQLEELFSGTKTSLSGRIRLQRPDAKDVWIEYRFVKGEVRAPIGPTVRGVLRDITQSYQLEKHITHMALHDALTELPNRVLLEDRTKVALRMAQRSGKRVALGFLDLDHFKNVNDQHGHKVGDGMLVALARNLRKALRAGDTLARWGGDEFVVLLPDLTGRDNATEVMNKLAAVCRQPLVIEGNEFNVTFSMGVALFPDDANSTETLLSHADRAMFFAKDQGRNTVRFYGDMENPEQDLKDLYIQNRLATAIKENQIQTWFQPIVDAQTHAVVGCEALARWHEETYGWVSPTTFIPMAESLGLIREIGHQVWTQTVDQLHVWRQMGLDLKVSVNVSRRQLFGASFTADLLDDLDHLAIPSSAVDLEITESLAMEDAEHTTARLLELTHAGFGIAIDDFGTGYSSLSQLHDMPATRLKIDISFVRRVHSEQGAQLIQAMVKIASVFHLQIVAEGVEDAATAETLRQMGVHQLQGYHFGRPMSAADFLAHLQRGGQKG